MAKKFEEICGINWLAVTCIKIIGKMKENIDEVHLKVEVRGSNNDQLLSTKLFFSSRGMTMYKSDIAVLLPLKIIGNQECIPCFKLLYYAPCQTILFGGREDTGLHQVLQCMLILNFSQTLKNRSIF